MELVTQRLGLLLIALVNVLRLPILALLFWLPLAFVNAAEPSASPQKDAATDDIADDEVTVDSVTVVRDVGGKLETTNAFKPADTFVAIVKITDPKDGTKVKVVWTAVDAGGVHDTKVFDKEVTITPELLKTAKEPARIDFPLAHKNPYPPGAYKVEVFLDGDLAELHEFKIE